MTTVSYEITLNNGQKIIEKSYQKTLTIIESKGGKYKVVYTPLVDDWMKRKKRA